MLAASVRQAFQPVRLAGSIPDAAPSPAPAKVEDDLDRITSQHRQNRAMRKVALRPGEEAVEVFRSDLSSSVSRT